MSLTCIQNCKKKILNGTVHNFMVILKISKCLENAWNRTAHFEGSKIRRTHLTLTKIAFSVTKL